MHAVTTIVENLALILVLLILVPSNMEGSLTFVVDLENFFADINSSSSLD